MFYCLYNVVSYFVQLPYIGREPVRISVPHKRSASESMSNCSIDWSARDVREALIIRPGLQKEIWVAPKNGLSYS